MHPKYSHVDGNSNRSCRILARGSDASGHEFAFSSLSRPQSFFCAVHLFCQSGSDRVDIKLWNVNRPQLHCLTCGRAAWVDGFTVIESDPGKLLSAALVDQALKLHKRNLAEMQQIDRIWNESRGVANARRIQFRT